MCKVYFYVWACVDFIQYIVDSEDVKGPERERVREREVGTLAQ